LGLVLGRGDDERNRVTEFHDVIDKDFDEINASGLEFDLAEKGYVGGIEGRIFEGEFHLAFSQDGGLVGSDEADGFGEVADAGGPTIEKAQAEGDDWNLGDADEVHHADEEEVAGDFLADFFAEQRALEIGEDAGGVHLLKAKGQSEEGRVWRAEGEETLKI
jgi:hypothetical protein